MFYDTWIYEWFNRKWFFWSLVVGVLGFNAIMPAFIWLIMTGRIKAWLKQRRKTGPR